MKLLTFALAVLTMQASAQRYEQYYDYTWKRTEPATARYYTLMEKKDSLWERKDYFIHEKKLQMRGSYTDTSCKVEEGDFVYYHASGFPESKGAYIHGKKQGVWLNYYNDGMMSDSSFYENGNKTGTSMGWHRNGYLSDSAEYNDDGSGVIISWFDNGLPSSAGRYTAGYKQNGKWQFFHRNGKISALETYKNGTMINKEYFDEEGNAITDTSNKDRPATFIGGNEAWKKYMSRHLYFPDQYKFENADAAVVVIGAVIDEEGNVTDVEVTDPLHPSFDKIALEMLKKSPRWTPAISHNRKVKYAIRQPVSFQQQ